MADLLWQALAARWMTGLVHPTLERLQRRPWRSLQGCGKSSVRRGPRELRHLRWNTVGGQQWLRHIDLHMRRQSGKRQNCGMRIARSLACVGDSPTKL